MMLALAPELVHLDRTQPDSAAMPTLSREPLEHIALLGPVAFAWTTDDISPAGDLGDPRRATRERGERHHRG